MTDPLHEWLKMRPECVQKLAQEFPPGVSFMMDEAMYYIIGYREPDTLIISHFNPAVHYDLARKNKKYICADHLR